MTPDWRNRDAGSGRAAAGASAIVEASVARSLPEWPVYVEVAEVASGDQRSGYIVRSGGIRVWIEAANGGDRRLQTRGLVSEEHHGGMPDAIPSTRGRVR